MNISTQNDIFSTCILDSLPCGYQAIVRLADNVTQKPGIKNIALREIDSTGKMVLSYLPRGKEAIMSADGEKWGRKNRQISAKPGKILREVFKDLGVDINDEDLIKLVNKIKSALQPQISVVTGDDITHSYHYDSYASTGTGTLSDSCMRHECCQGYVNWYSEQVNCSLAIMKNAQGKLIARALLWTTVQGHTVMDRIYGTEASIESFKKFAEKHKYYHKKEQNYSNSTFVSYDELATLSYNEVVTLSDLQVDLTTSREEDFPFLDTFKYYDRKLSLSTVSTSEYNLELTEVDGGPGEGSRECANCYGHLDNIDYVIVNNDECCYECAVTDDNGEGMLTSEAIYIEDIQCFVHSTRAVFSADRGIFMLAADAVYSAHMRDFLETCNAVYSNYHVSYLSADEVTYIESEDDYYLNNRVTYDSATEEHILIANAEEALS